jgi:very-short-patch-repair endonuclease
MKPIDNHHYNPKLKDFARKLRTESVSKAEKFIWKAALSRKQLGYGFKRQRPINRYIVDFFCAELNLIIEIDGNSHYFKAEEDAIRQSNLEQLGYTIVRFDEGVVLNQFEDVYKSLCHVVDSLKEQKVD